MQAYILYGYIDWKPLRFICRFLAAKFVILRNWWVLLAAASEPFAAPYHAALRCVALCCPSLPRQRLAGTSLICSRRHANAVRCQVTQFHPVSTRARAHTALRQCHLMAHCVWVCVCVRWLVYCGPCPPPSHLLVCICRNEYPLAGAEYHPARLMIMLIFAFRNNLLWTLSFHPGHAPCLRCYLSWLFCCGFHKHLLPFARCLWVMLSLPLVTPLSETNFLLRVYVVYLYSIHICMYTQV